MNHFSHPISRVIWEMKYRLTRPNGTVEQSIEDTWRRVAKAIAGAEKHPNREKWEKAFYQILDHFQFLPGGRILAGAGTEHQHVTLFNCFVMNIAEDSLNGIFDSIKEGALTLQQGGGVGYDFSVLRPRGSPVLSADAVASGAVSFMRVWDAMSSVMMSTGARRGAMMGVLRCDHPDIEEFITAKKDAHELRNFNVSVMVSDAFMLAVKEDADWPLEFEGVEYKRVRARQLWEKIIRSAYEYAEPGVLFGDTINRLNNLYYCEKINAVNPCGEIPLPPYGACDLGAINLTQFVENAFASNAQINWSRLEETASIATRFLDNVIDVSHYPLDAQKIQAQGTRRIGLGITGLADALVMLGIQYGGEASLKIADEIMRRIAHVTWQTSINLAKEKGVFPFYKKEFLEGEFVKSLDTNLLRQLAVHGVRNSHHNTIAPAGTISLLANNISNGIEPIFKSDYDRHVRQAEGGHLTFQVEDYAWRLWHEKNSTVDMPKAWVDTASLSPNEHLEMQAVMQKHIDNAISKTINIPRDFPFSKLAEVYTRAYELGLKGCTVFRPNPITGSVLEETVEKDDDVDRCCRE